MFKIFATLPDGLVPAVVKFGWLKHKHPTVNPSNNRAHCFHCEENLNNIDLMMLQGHELVPAVGELASASLCDLGLMRPKE
jgi:hypothetical protein